MAILAKKQICSTPCMITKWAAFVLLLLVTVAALVGVYMTHVIGGDFTRLQFGSTGGSLSILAFTFALVSSMKQFVCCMSGCEVCPRK